MTREEARDIHARLDEIESNFENRIDELEKQLAYGKGMIGMFVFICSCMFAAIKLLPFIGKLLS